MNRSNRQKCTFRHACNWLDLVGIAAARRGLYSCFSWFWLIFFPDPPGIAPWVISEVLRWKYSEIGLCVWYSLSQASAGWGEQERLWTGRLRIWWNVSMSNFSRQRGRREFCWQYRKIKLCQFLVVLFCSWSGKEKIFLTWCAELWDWGRRGFLDSVTTSKTPWHGWRWIERQVVFSFYDLISLVNIVNREVATRE